MKGDHHDKELVDEPSREVVFADYRIVETSISVQILRPPVQIRSTPVWITITVGLLRQPLLHLACPA